MSVFKRGGRWQYDFWVNSRRYRGSIPEARVKTQAERAETAIRDSVYAGKYGTEIESPLFSTFMEETFLPWSRSNKRTWRNDTYYAKTLVGAFGRLRLDEISPLAVEKFKRKRLETPIVFTKKVDGKEVETGRRDRRPASVNRELEILKRSINLAMELGMTTFNPCSKVRYLREDNQRERYLSDDEEKRLLKACEGRLQHLTEIIMLALQTGMRRGELLQLRWSQVDFQRGLIHVVNDDSQGTKTKNGRSRSVPLTSVARDVLLSISGHYKSRRLTPKRVFTNPNTGLAYVDIKKAFAAARTAAGLPDVHFHDLRHTTATRLGDRGASAFEIAALLGWSDIRMAMRYAHATGDGLRRAAEMLAQAPEVEKAVAVGGVIEGKFGQTDAKVPTSKKNGQHALPVSD
jgi:integrase